jgi:endonuclease/exonuclease/phosphatase family metal-dependent hydrolase
MTSPARPSGELRVSVSNLEYGGLSGTGDDSAWCKSMAWLLDWAPDVLLLQEVNGRAPFRLHAHLWRTANELGMTPVLGPASPDSVSGNHPAVLVNTVAGLQILDAGPPPYPAGGAAPAWCEVQVTVPGMTHPVWFISVHLPARSATSQHIQAERLACLVAQRGGLVIAGGDWNGYAPADQLTHPVLEELPAHLRPARMRLGAEGRLEPDYHAHRALASVGLADAAAELPAGRRTPPELTPTGITGGARVDRIYLTGSLVPALERYEQAATGGSDHQALLLTLRTGAAAGITPPPPLP